MTFGEVVTLGAASTGLFTAVYHWVLLRKLPTRTQPGYDETAASPALAHKITIATGLALPVVAYAVFRLLDPELFQTQLF